MRKLKLDLHDLQVDTFHTSPMESGRGTVEAYLTTAGCHIATAPATWPRLRTRSSHPRRLRRRAHRESPPPESA